MIITAIPVIPLGGWKRTSPVTPNCCLKYPRNSGVGLQYEAGDPYNLEQLIDAYDQNFGFLSWDAIWEMVRKTSRADHTEYYGGVYPGKYKGRWPTT